MMDILVFLVVIFGILGVFISQYISQYREIYLLWLDEIVFTDFYTRDISVWAPSKCSDCPIKSDQSSSCSKTSCSFKSYSSSLCSKVESYAREICTYADIIKILVSVVCGISAFAVLFSLIAIFVPGADVTPNSVYTYVFVEILIIIINVIIIHLLAKAGIDILHPNRTDKIDEKLFDIWCKYDCHFSKNTVSQKNLQPTAMYEILAQKIYEYKIRDNDTDNDKIIACVVKERIDRKRSKVRRKSDKLIDLMRGDKDLKKIMEEGK